jgi:hypothetical protein
MPAVPRMCTPWNRAPCEPNLIYAGTANAGIWMSTDKGLNWTNVTKAMMIGSVVAARDRPHGENTTCTSGRGGPVEKTTDGGTNWSSIGDATFQGLNHSIKRHRAASHEQPAALRDQRPGPLAQHQCGASFTQVQSGSWQELELKPGDPNTVYAIKQISNRTEFWRSTDNGVSFTAVGAGWPNPVSPDEQKRTEIAVSAAAPNSVYALCTGEADGGSGLYGVYKSTDKEHLDLPMLRHRAGGRAVGHEHEPDGLERCGH